MCLFRTMILPILNTKKVFLQCTTYIHAYIIFLPSNKKCFQFSIAVIGLMEVRRSKQFANGKQIKKLGKNIVAWPCLLQPPLSNWRNYRKGQTDCPQKISPFFTKNQSNKTLKIRKISPKIFRKTGKSVFFDSLRPNFTTVEEIFGRIFDDSQSSPSPWLKKFSDYRRI